MTTKKALRPVPDPAPDVFRDHVVSCILDELREWFPEADLSIGEGEALAETIAQRLEREGVDL